MINNKLLSGRMMGFLWFINCLNVEAIQWVLGCSNLCQVNYPGEIDLEKQTENNGVFGITVLHL